MKKKFVMFRCGRLIFITLLLGGVFLQYGCTTFGTFSNLKQNKSTTDEVRKLLGEPEQIRSEQKHDIWEYTFVKPFRRQALLTSQKVLETKIFFQNGVMTDYQIDVVTKPIPENEGRKMQQGMGPSSQELIPRARHFLEKFDINKDGHITKNEYNGPPRLFDILDSNHDNIIDSTELKKFPRNR